MYGTTLAQAVSLLPPSPQRTASVFTTLGVTAILSWPFAAVLVIVFAFQDLVQSRLQRQQLVDVFKGALMAVAYILSALVTTSLIPG